MEKMHPIPGFDSYFLTKSGKIYSTKKSPVWHELRYSLAGAGYPSVTLCVNGKHHKVYIHRMMALTFLNLNKQPTLNVNHKNGIKTDNSLENLELVTKSENTKHAYRHGLLHSGVKHYKATLSREDVVFIRNNPHLKSREMAKKFNCHQGTISRIKNFTLRRFG